MAHAELVGAVLDGRYKVIEPVAEGAMGVVYRAERLKLGRTVAVKVLHDELPDELASAQRFEREAMAMAKLEHPHCAAVLDVGTHEGKPFVVMDFVTGSDLKSLIVLGPTPVPRAVEIVRQVLSGLAHAHELGIIHRDIKPANIMLSQKAGLGDHVKILDFGLARLKSETTSNLTTGIVVGTPAYMAPEQIRGTLIDHRADLYACGVLLMELVTGKKPFHSEKDDPVEVVRMHLNKPAPRLDALLPGVDFGPLEAVVAKALAKDPDDRYQTATEMVAALEALGTRAQEASSLALPVASEPSMMGVSDSMVIPQGGTRLGIPVAPVPHVASAPIPAPVPHVASAPIVQAPSPPVASAPIVQAPPPPVAHANPDGLPFTRKQIAIAGGSMLGLIILVALFASGGGKQDEAPATSPPATGSAEIEMEPDIDAEAAKILSEAEALVANGQREAAIDLLTKQKRAFPTDPRFAYEAGKLYFAKLWWTDGVKMFREAVRIDARMKTDPELIKIVLKGFITTPSYNGELASFLRQDIGAPAAPYLEETARDHPNASVRARAAKELERFR